ncbi:MAG: hypothetical protein OJF49_003236 [Ktedonobacterales bacterium]|jgi:hypothetical protein|nr:MAG: hypothetical protein OJF49_003236 [Ktedonobacterales bacterium]
MLLTTVRLERPEGTVLLRGISVQIEQATELALNDLEGARSYDRFWLYTLQGVPTTAIARRDVLFDEVNVDAETGTLAKYRVSGLVETFAGDHQEALVERVVGN